MYVYAEQLYDTLVEIIRIPSTSGHEEYVRSYLEKRLREMGIVADTDERGNLIARVEGEGQPLLLNAHMDRVPPGLGHVPTLRDGTLYSDGSTNLGADDAAGIAVILEVLRRTREQTLPHPPLIIVFTVQEETGLCGANNFDAGPWQVRDGIVFDNAFEAGVVVSAGATYEAFDVKILGHTGHPGKELAGTVDALEIFRQTQYLRGTLANDKTRISIGRVTAGTARNTIPDRVTIEGEIRSFESPQIRERYRQEIQYAFEETARRMGGKAEVNFATYAPGYTVSPDEPLLKTYQQVLTHRGAKLVMKPTFIGSDSSGFRPAIRSITISTGVVKEHSVEENVALAPLEELINDTLYMLHLWREQTG